MAGISTGSSRKIKMVNFYVSEILPITVILVAYCSTVSLGPESDKLFAEMRVYT